MHTEYSLLDGLSKITTLMNHVKENDMDTIALTDHGAMYGAVEFFKKAKKEEVKPIIGMEGYITHGKMQDRPERSKMQNYHVLFLAKDNEGYKNLMKISSLAHLEGYYYRPRIDHETLAKYSKGIICTSACALGELDQAIINEDPKEVKKVIEWYRSVFGEDYYLEVQKHEYEKAALNIVDQELKANALMMAENEKKINSAVMKLSKEYGIPVIATNDAHYIKAEDATAQDALICIATGKNVSDTKRMRFIDTPGFYVKSPTEMESLFSDTPEVLSNTVKVAEKCNVEIELGKWFFPKFDVPDGKTDSDYLRETARKRLKEVIPGAGKEAEERLEYELEIITQKGYSPYFLIVMDLANWSNGAGIITNTRGSAAGSLVSFVLGITTVNPLLYYLPFERFLNPFRPSPPDIDFDVADDRRQEIIGYIVDKYGHDKVAQICTFGRMLSRAAVRDVARVLGYPYTVGDRIAKLIPPPKQGFPITIPKALAEVPELKSLYDSDSDSKKVLSLATQVEGNARHLSVHAAGVVVAQSVLTDYAPIQKEPSGDKIITQYEFHACEDVGLIKLDILGIRNLSILGAAVKLVKEDLGVDINLRKLPLDDKKTFEMLGRGETMGVFQMGGSGMTKYLKDLKPERVEDLMAMVALYRPGPIAVIPEYIKRKQNPSLVKYLDPRMEKFLGSSYGLIVYQDDLLFCALDLAGYTWEEADKFRKAVGKKIPEEMAAQKDKFTKGIVANGQTEDFAEKLWLLFEPFQAYGFNKAHAASYGIVSYYTAYMKANYPAEYMTALLTAESGDNEKVSSAINECHRVGLKILPPDINESKVDFTIIANSESLDNKAIRFGLSAIKNVGNAAIDAILEARAEGPFASLPDFLSRIDARRVNKKVIESLIKVGALSAFGGRASLLASIDEIRSRVKPKKESQQGLFSTEDIDKVKLQDNSILIEVEEFSDEELQNLERQLLGLSLSAKPISEALLAFAPMATHKINEVETGFSKTEIVKVAGVVTAIRPVVTKKTGAEMAFVKFEDETGTIDLVIFPKIYAATKAFWVDNRALLVSGRVDDREDTPSILVESIQTTADMETIGKGEETLFVKIPDKISGSQLKELKDLLLSYPGSQQVTLVFEGNGEKLTLPFTISWSEKLSRQIAEVIAGSTYSGVE